MFSNVHIMTNSEKNKKKQNRKQQNELHLVRAVFFSWNYVYVY